MKTTRLLKSMLLLCALIVGSTSVWGADVTYTFTSKNWTATPYNWTNNKSGYQNADGRGVYVTASYSGANGNTNSSFTNVSQIIVTYSTNESAGAGSIGVQVGENDESSQAVTNVGGTTERTLTYDFSPVQTGAVKLTVTCTTNSIYVKSVKIVYESDATFATLPFAWAGGTKEQLTELNGVVGNSLGADYAESSAPYRVRFDAAGDYIQINMNKQPGRVKVGVKLPSAIDIGSPSKITVKSSSDGGNSFSDIETFNLSGNAGTLFSLETTNPLKIGDRCIRIEFTERNGNLAIGPINIEEGTTINLSNLCTDNTNYFATYSNTNAFVVPSDLTVSEITVSGNTLTMHPYSTGDVVAANTGVLLSSTTSGDHVVALTSADATNLGVENVLHHTGSGITAVEMATAAPSCKYYRLTMHNGTDLGFWWGAASGAAFDLAANKAYLAIPITNAREGFAFDNEATGIAEMKAKRNVENEKFYILTGQRVNANHKGLVIVNGKKYLNK